MDYRSKNYSKYLIMYILQFMVHPEGCTFSCKYFINRDEEVTIKGIEKTNRGFSFIYLTIGNMKFGIFPKKKNEFWMAILDLKEDGTFEISRKINDVLKLGSAYLIYDDINNKTIFVEKVYGYNTNIIFDGKMFDFEKESVMIKLEGLK